jgi:ABC-type lipoprotein release transport system permease subunit
MNYFKIAWRNIWRNKRRTLITVASLYFAIVTALFMRSMQIGTYDLMIENAVQMYSGFIQIQEKDYWEDKTINNLMEKNQELEKAVEEIGGVNYTVPRLESFSLASSGDHTKGVVVQGVLPALEDSMTKLKNRLVKGDYLSENDIGVLVSQKLASFLKLNVGDTIIMISQGYHGVSAADQFPVRGIVKIPNPQLDNRLIIGSLSKIQSFFSAENMLTSVVVHIDSRDNVDRIASEIKSLIDKDKLRVMSWTEMNKSLKQQIDSDNVSGVIMLAILYIVIFFGLFGTIVMMTAERRKEFAVMLAIGMHRSKIILIVIFETLILGFFGLMAGVVSSLPFFIYYHDNPIRLTGEYGDIYESFGMEPLMGFSLNPSIFMNQFILVGIMLLFVLIYPTFKISKLNIINSIRL